MEVCPAYEPIIQFKSKMSLDLNVHPWNTPKYKVAWNGNAQVK